MKPRRSQAFRPCGELVEQRLLTAALPSMRAALAQRAQRQQQFQQFRNRPVNPALRPPLARMPGVTIPGVNGPTTGIGAGFLGNQGPRINRPSTPPPANANFGVITITNTTQAEVTISISASTYQGGKFFNFTFTPGQKQVYFAQFGGPFDSAPTFQVSFDTVDRRYVFQLAEVATVYAPTSWVPTLESPARPYAIVADPGGLNIVPA